MRNYWKVKPIKIHFGFDTDKDRVKDRFDCRPFNPKKQHISSTTKERLKSLDIEVIGERGEGKGKRFHVMSKEAKMFAPMARAQIFSVINKHPNVLGELERASAKGSILWTHDSRAHSGWALGSAGRIGDEYPVDIDTRPDYYGADEEYDYQDMKDKYIRSRLGETILHELKHVEQDYGKDKYPDTVRYLRRRPISDKDWEEAYWSSPRESEARVSGFFGATDRYARVGEKEMSERRKKFFKLIK